MAIPTLANKVTLYKVSFTFNDDYRPKTEGFMHCSLVVEANDKFDALHKAWDFIAPLGLIEPIKLDCSKVEKSDC